MLLRVRERLCACYPPATVYFVHPRYEHLLQAPGQVRRQPAVQHNRPGGHPSPHVHTRANRPLTPPSFHLPTTRQAPSDLVGLDALHKMSTGRRVATMRGGCFSTRHPDCHLRLLASFPTNIASIPLPQAARGLQRRGAKAAERVGSLASLSRPVPRALHARHRVCPSPAHHYDAHTGRRRQPFLGPPQQRRPKCANGAVPAWRADVQGYRPAKTEPRHSSQLHCAIPSLRLRAVVCSFGTRRGRPIWALRRANARATSLLRKDGLCLRSNRGAPRSRFIAGSHAALPSDSSLRPAQVRAGDELDRSLRNRRPPVHRRHPGHRLSPDGRRAGSGVVTARVVYSLALAGRARRVEW